MLPLGLTKLDACPRRASWTYVDETTNGHFPASFEQDITQWYVVEQDDQLPRFDELTTDDITRSYNE